MRERTCWHEAPRPGPVVKRSTSDQVFLDGRLSQRKSRQDPAGTFPLVWVRVPHGPLLAGRGSPSDLLRSASTGFIRSGRSIVPGLVRERTVRQQPLRRAALRTRGTRLAATSAAALSTSGCRLVYVYVSDVSVIVECRSVSLIVGRPPPLPWGEGRGDVPQVPQGDGRKVGPREDAAEGLRDGLGVEPESVLPCEHVAGVLPGPGPHFSFSLS